MQHEQPLTGKFCGSHEASGPDVFHPRFELLHFLQQLNPYPAFALRKRSCTRLGHHNSTRDPASGSHHNGERVHKLSTRDPRPPPQACS